MDGCSIQDAFPSGPFASTGCVDTKVAEESRRQEKKRARKCRGPHGTYLNNGYNMVGAIGPDKVSQNLSATPAYDAKIGLSVHNPVTEQYNYETFVGGMDDLPSIRKDIQGQTALQSGSTPSFFGASPNDETPTASRQQPGLVETFQSSAAPFVDVIGQNESATLEPDFRKSFSLKGASRAEGSPIASGPSPVNQESNYLTPTGMLPNSILPVPNLDLFWKDGTGAIAGGQSSFFSHLKAPGGQPSGSIEAPDYSSSDRREMLSKLDRIFARLDDVEASRVENSQTEVLLFILTGLGVIFLMDVGCRAALGFRR